MTEVVLINPATAPVASPPCCLRFLTTKRGFVDPRFQDGSNRSAGRLLAPCRETAHKAVDGDVWTNLQLGFCRDVESDQQLVLLGVGLFDNS